MNDYVDPETQEKEMELVDTLKCDELCVMDNKEEIKDIVDDKIVEKGCSCSRDK